MSSETSLYHALGTYPKADFQKPPDFLYIAVIHYSGDEAGDEVIRCFGKRKYFIKSKTMRKEKTEMAVEIFCKQTDMDFMEKIRAIEHVDDDIDSV